MATGLLAGAQSVDRGRVLLATVTDAGNRALVDLDVDDFVVSEGGAPREVLSVRIADYPVVLLLDNSTAAGASVSAIRAAAARFVTRIGDRSVAILTLADPPVPLATFEDGRAVVLDAIGRMPAGETQARPLQGLALAAALIAETESPFATVVLVAVRPVDPGPAEPRGLLGAFLETRAILHAVLLTPPPTPGAPAALTSLDLAGDLPVRTGGRTLSIYSPISFQAALDQVADRLATEMLVEYLVPAGAPVSDDVRVGVAVPGARVRGLGVLR